jgi:hypothetical protein
MKKVTGRPQDDPMLAISRGSGRIFNVVNRPFLYHRTDEEIELYRRKPVKQKLQWLQAQMEFFYKAMPKNAKKIRDKLMKGEL